MTTQHILFEIGCEELPAKGLENLSQQLYQLLTALLNKHQLAFDSEGSTHFATPRRLGLFIKDCQSAQAPQHTVRKGPKLAQAYLADGNPTMAALGFAKSCGVAFSELTCDAEGLCFSKTAEGKNTLALLPSLLADAIQHLPIARPMRWGSENHAFARPVKWLLALFGTQIIPMELFAIQADRYSYGHRFMAPEAISFDEANRADYEHRLQQAHVIASFTLRQQSIEQQVHQLALEQQGQAVLDSALLTEVTGLVEWPVALSIPFAPEFLDLPAEALIASMQSHQKCFAIEKSAGMLMPAFITIANIDSKAPQKVIDGNARVMKARLSDAQFFYEQDLKIPLENYSDTLAKMTFQHQLGSMLAKTHALEAVSEYIAPLLNADAVLAQQSARLAKSDLCCHMVGEFPELQGIMGRAYARHQQLDPAIAEALHDQYLPRFAGDGLPAAKLGATLALADRLLNVVGIFAIGQYPTGDKDPFALRRAALGAIRIILDQETALSLTALLQNCVDSWQKQQPTLQALDTVNKVHHFILERLRYFWLEHNDFSHAPKETLNKAIDAVLTTHNDDLKDCRARLLAIVEFQNKDEAPALASANKRVNNFLNKEKIATTETLIQTELFEQAIEAQLFTQVQQMQQVIEPLLHAQDYVGVLHQLAALKEVIDAFFNEVMVLAEDLQVRQNRLSLLHQLQGLLASVADLSAL